MRSSFIASVGVIGDGDDDGRLHTCRIERERKVKWNLFELAIAVQNHQGFRVRAVPEKYNEAEEPLNIP